MAGSVSAGGGLLWLVRLRGTQMACDVGVLVAASKRMMERMPMSECEWHLSSIVCWGVSCFFCVFLEIMERKIRGEKKKRKKKKK